MCGFCAGRARLAAHMAGSVRACLDEGQGAPEATEATGKSASAQRMGTVPAFAVTNCHSGSELAFCSRNASFYADMPSLTTSSTNQRGSS